MSKATPTSHQITLLVVEDDEALRDAFACILVHEGYMVLTAATGHDAMGLLRTPLTPIDVVLLDVKLPDVSGVDLCARLREIYPQLPVVVCTGQAEPEELAALQKLGVRSCLCKPVAMDELIAAIEDFVPLKETCGDGNPSLPRSSRR